MTINTHLKNALPRPPFTTISLPLSPPPLPLPHTTHPPSLYIFSLLLLITLPPLSSTPHHPLLTTPLSCPLPLSLFKLPAHPPSITLYMLIIDAYLYLFINIKIPLRPPTLLPLSTHNTLLLYHHPSCLNHLSHDPLSLLIISSSPLTSYPH